MGMQPNVRKTAISYYFRRFLDSVALLLSLEGLIACSTLFGTIKPVTEKSKDYSIMDLASAKPTVWTVLDGDELYAGMGGTGAERSYQSKFSGATISIDSSCQALPGTQHSSNFNLKALSSELFRGMSQLEIVLEKPMQLSKLKAWRTHARASADKGKLDIRAVVARSEKCVFDLMFVGKAPFLEQEVEHFESFLRSFKLK